MHKHEEALKQMFEGLESLQASINEIADTDRQHLGFIATRVTNRLQTEKAFINSLRGVSAAPIGDVHDINQPVKTVMGKPVEHRKPVTHTDITPTNLERENYLNDVQEMLANFDKLDDEAIFRKVELGGENVIRGVAKRAGVPHYGTATIDVLFIASIRAAMKATAEQNAKLAAANKSITDKKK